MGIYYVSGDSSVGGVCGSNSGGNYGTISNCYNAGTVSGNSYVGGVCGESSSTVSSCYNTGTVCASGEYSEVGGVCGSNSFGTVSNCYNASTVSGNRYAGGVCGENFGIVSNCYNTGRVGGEYYVGGVCGGNGGTVSYCYNTGTVIGDNYNVGGVCGNNNAGTINNCYYLTDCAVDGSEITQCGIGAFPQGSTLADISGTTEELTDAQMKLQSSFVGFDFENVWAMGGNTIYSYPVLVENTPKAEAKEAVWDGTIANGFASGKGTESDPYIVETAEQLAYLAYSVNAGTDYSEKYIKLVKDIYINDTEGWENWAESAPTNEWTPIGTDHNGYVFGQFGGIFDGCGYKVLGIYLNDGTSGLFGYNKGTIKDVGVEKSFIFCGSAVVGGVCGENDGTVSNCYNAGTVSGNSFVGGVCGWNRGDVVYCYNTGTVSGNYYVGGVCGGNSTNISSNPSSTVNNCYNMGTVSGNDNVGGVCGECGIGEWFPGVVSNCYNTGTVSGNYNVGGVCGENSGTVSNCYYLIGCAVDRNGTTQYGIGTSSSGSSVADISGATTGLTDAQMKLQSSFVGFDFENVWAMGNSTTYSYPVLIENAPKAEENDAVWDGTVASGFAGGTGTEDDPYIIETAEQLAYLAYSVSAGTEYYGEFIKLTNDIFLNDTEGWENWAESAPANEWTPIGTENSAFMGTFDGDGHKILGIYLNSGEFNQGLFGYNTGEIKNVGVEKSYIGGGCNVGGVCGYNKGTVGNCYNTGTVSGNGEVFANYVGGVCGFNIGPVSKCYSTGSVSGRLYVGGVCGGDIDGTVYAIVSNCYNTGSVSGYYGVGGVCGDNISGTICNCYNMGYIKGNYFVGGVCGDNVGTVSNCYYLFDHMSVDGDVTSESGIGGGVADRGGSTAGLFETQMKKQGSFVGFDFENVWSIVPSTGYPYPILHVHSYTDVVTDPTCTEQGYTTHTCSVCGDVYTDTYTAALGHDFTDYVSDENATCTVDGTKTAHCNREGCLETDTVTDIGTKGHIITSIVTDPTCTEQGYTTHTCSVCGDVYTDTYTAALGHDFTDYVSDNNATCTVDGTKTAHCNHAGCTETDTVTDVGSKLGHSFGQPTYVWNGSQCTATRICTHDAKHVETETVTGTYVKDADAKCSVNEKGHYLANFKNQAFSSQTTAANSAEKTGTALTHYYEWIIDREAAPGAEGCKHEECSYCHDIRNANTPIPALPSSVLGDLDEIEGIDINDAIYLMYHTIFPDKYPINQTGDLNGDGVTDINDAIHLMYYTIFPDKYPLVDPNTLKKKELAV